MKEERETLKQWLSKLRRVLFSSPDRVLSTISLVVGTASLVLSTWAYLWPEPIPGFIIARDFLLVAFLVLFICVLALKYFKKDELVEKFRELLADQLMSCHQLAHKFRNHFFSEVRAQVVKGLTEKTEVESTKKNYFKKVCHSVLTDVREVFLQYFEARGFKIEDDLTVTLKALMNSEEARGIADHLDDRSVERLGGNKEFLVTAFRDPYSWERKADRKEVKSVLYEISEANTAFQQIFKEGQCCFVCNNLKQASEEGKYRNENAEWMMLYNSTIVVPIRHVHDYKEDVTIYGVLAVDSKNRNGHALFDESTTYNMLAYAADMLAIMFAHIEILEILADKEQECRNTSQTGQKTSY